MKKVDPATIELYVLYDLYVCLTDVCIDRCKKSAVTIFSLLSIARIFFANMYALSLKCWLINRLTNLLFINCLEINLP